jgi:hypothetical protein
VNALEVELGERAYRALHDENAYGYAIVCSRFDSAEAWRIVYAEMAR